MDRAAGWIVPQALMLFAGCTGCMGTQSGTESSQPPAECRILEETSLTPSAETEFGTALEVTEQFAKSMSAPLRWRSFDEQDAMETVVDVKLTAAIETATYLEREGDCGNALTFEATLNFATRDGAFAEHLVGTLELDAFGNRFESVMALEALAGSYEATAIEHWYQEPILTFRTRLLPLQGELLMDDGDETQPADSSVVVVSASLASWNEAWAPMQD